MNLPRSAKVQLPVAILIAAAVGCVDSETEFLVQVNFDSSLGLTQLQFSGAPEQGAGFGPIRKPEAPGLPLRSGQTVRIRFPDGFAGQAVRLDVDGLVEGRSIVASRISAVVARKRTIRLNLDLTPDNVDGGLPDGGGNCADCQTGCCLGSRCNPNPSFPLCGTDGGLCLVCAPQFSDNCSQGTCRCGAGNACGNGQECDGGACVCTPHSCPSGCCQPDGGCLSPPETWWTSPRQDSQSCGNVGLDCVQCPPCGSLVCAAPPSCLSGGVCDSCPGRCPAGCCSGDRCLPGNSMIACGTNGSACAVCDPTTSNNCVDGGCQCGAGPPCALVGQRCAATDGGVYQCVCDRQLCSPGCCQDGVICQQPGTSESACGSGGSACAVCDPPSRCIYQRCQVLPSP